MHISYFTGEKILVSPAFEDAKRTSILDLVDERKARPDFLP